MVDSKSILLINLQNKMVFLNLRINPFHLLTKHYVYNILKYDIQILIDLFMHLNSSGTNRELNSKIKCFAIELKDRIDLKSKPDGI